MQISVSLLLRRKTQFAFWLERVSREHDEERNGAKSSVLFLSGKKGVVEEKKRRL
jgi:hypothetical protein